MQGNTTEIDERNLLPLDALLSHGYGLSPQLVMRSKGLSIEAKALYGYLSSFAGAGDTAFPSTSRILEELDISKNRFYKIRKELVSWGFISIETTATSAGLRTVYTLPQNPIAIKTEIDEIANRRNEIKSSLVANLHSLKKESGPTRYTLAYSDLREALENRGFEHRQGSGYISKAPISKNKLIVLYDSLVEELPWLNTCSTAMHFADIGKTFNLKTLARNSSTSISDVEFFRNQGTQKRTSRASAESKTQSARATGKDNIIQFAPRQNGKDIPSSKGTSLASKSQKYVAMANALNAASKSYVYRNEVAR